MRAAQLAPEVEGLPEGVTDEAEIPEAFIKVNPPDLFFADHQTAHLSMDIIRRIHTSLGGIAVPDTELFSDANLLIIKRHFQVLHGEGNTDQK
jgi:hypothetical protein